MSSKLLQASILSALAGCGAGAFLVWFVIRRKTLPVVAQSSEPPAIIVKTVEDLQWNPLEERHGLGDLIERVNHITIVVSDVGRSLNFYVNTLGFQEIRRPNLDRPGAWLTMGNIELHLIEGTPMISPSDSLAVGHIALETSRIDEALQKLRALNIQFRQQNIPLSNSEKSGENQSQGSEPSHDSTVIQYFFTDPDGYYLELCNCDILAEFCFSREKLVRPIPYNENLRSCHPFGVVYAALRWKRKAKQKVCENLHGILKDTLRAAAVSEEGFTFGDTIEGCTDEEIKEALLQAQNFVQRSETLSL